MGLTTKKRLDLEDSEFDVCYEENKDLWRAIVLETDEFARSHNPDPMEDDLSLLVYSQLLTNKEFRAFMGGAALSADKWYRWFAEYIVHLEWQPVLNARKKSQGGTQ